MASLEDLLEEDGFRRRSKENPRLRARNSFKFEVCKDLNPVSRTRSVPPSGELVIRRNSAAAHTKHLSRQETTKYFAESSSQKTTEYFTESSTQNFAESSSARATTSDSSSARKVSREVTQESNKAETALDEAAVKAVISMLGGFCKRFINNKELRTAIREKYASCLRLKEHKNQQHQQHAEQVVVANLDWGIDGVEKAVAAARATDADDLAASLRNATRLLSVAASLDGEGLKDSSTDGLRNSCLAACGHFYLAIAYKLQKNDRLAAIHVLQVFCTSPSHGRRVFCREIWDHLFLPHLVHLKVWYNEQYDIVDADYDANSSYNPERWRKLKKLRKMYNEQLDEGTRQFALYYKEWLMIGVKGRAAPTINPPSTPPKEIESSLGVMGSPPRTPLRRSMCSGPCRCSGPNKSSHQDVVVKFDASGNRYCPGYVGNALVVVELCKFWECYACTYKCQIVMCARTPCFPSPSSTKG